MQADDNNNPQNFHGVLVKVNNVGILLTGKSGCGKSELALSLISRGHQLIADDAPLFYTENDELMGKCPAMLQDYLQVNSLGILNIRALFGDKAIALQTQLQLIIKLVSKHKNTANDYLHGNAKVQKIMGKAIPEIILPEKSQYLTTLVECANRNYFLQQHGFNANEVFMMKQQQVMA